MADLAADLTPADDEALLDQAQELVRDDCGWHISPVREDTYTLPYWGSAILLPTLKLVSVTSIEDANGNDLTTQGGFTATDGGILRRGSAATQGSMGGYLWPAGTVVVFTHGYEDPPASITRAVQSIAGRKQGQLQEKVVGPFREFYGDILAAIPNKYRIPVV